MSEAPREGEQEPKRRRRSGWDVQTPAAVPGQQADEAFLQQQAQIALQAQQIAIQKAQQLIAQQAIQKTLATTLGGITANLPKPGCRIYVGSIHYDLKESDVVALFSTFGTVTKSEMSIDPATQRSKGFCFIEYADQACAEAAMAMDGFEIAGRKIKVGKPFHGQGAPAAAPGMQIPGLGIPGLGIPGLGIPGLGIPGYGYPAAAPPLPVPIAAQTPALAPVNPEDLKMYCVLVSNVASVVEVPEIETIFSAFGAVVQCKPVPSQTASSSSSAGSAGGATKRVVVEYADVAIAASTAASMQAFELGGLPLQCEVISRQRSQQLLLASPAAPATAVDSTYCSVVLQHMVTLEDTKDPDLKEEISEEARNYGNLRDVELIINEAKGEVQVRLIYADHASAAKAHKAMNGRAFAGNKISAVLAP